MPPLLRPSITTALLVVALACPLSGRAQDPTDRPGAASGQVVQAVTNRGIMGAFLLAFDESGEVVGRGLSGREGLFTVILPAGGPYRLEVESMGYRITTSDTLRIAPADTLRLAPILLVPDTTGRQRELQAGRPAYTGP